MALGLMVVAIATARGVVADGPATETPANPTAASLTPAESRLKADVSFLAADAQEGRAPGTKGIEASAEYIADTFKKLGLKPAPGADGYFQKFTVKGRPRLGEPLELITSYDGGVIPGDTDTLGDGRRRERVIAGDHDDTYPRRAALRDRVGDTRARRIEHRDQAGET